MGMGVPEVLLSGDHGAIEKWRQEQRETFSLIVLPENQHMLGLLRKMGWIHKARLSGGVYEITFDLPRDA